LWPAVTRRQRCGRLEDTDRPARSSPPQSFATFALEPVNLADLKDYGFQTGSQCSGTRQPLVRRHADGQQGGLQADDGLAVHAASVQASGKLEAFVDVVGDVLQGQGD